MESGRELSGSATEWTWWDSSWWDQGKAEHELDAKEESVKVMDRESGGVKEGLSRMMAFFHRETSQIVEAGEE